MTSAVSATTKPLDVAVVGAGLGGFAAAIALRKQGHIVQVFEASALNKEVGAAIVIPPNAMRVLEAFGYEHKNLKSGDYRGVVLYMPDGETHPDVFKDQTERFGYQGSLCLRTAIHEELKRLAIKQDGPGTPVKVHLGTEIVDCDPEAGTLASKTREKFEADVIIAADGIQSTLRTSLLAEAVVAPPTGLCAFRWMTDASKLQGHPELEELLKGVSGGRLALGPGPNHHGHSIFFYPCENGTKLNVTMWHPDARDQEQHAWYTPSSRAEMLTEYDAFTGPFRAFIELAEEPVNLWQMRVLPLLPTWTRGRLALLGDSAHATFPTLGQGAAMAIEDAAALGVVFPAGTTRADVPARLEAYQHLRKERGEFVNRESLEQITVAEKRGLYQRSQQMQDDLNGYDAIVVAQEYFDGVFCGKA